MSVTLGDFDYPFAGRNQLLVDGFKHYFKTHRGETKKLWVAYFYARKHGFDTKKLERLHGGYVVLSSSTYNRYYNKNALKNDPELTRRARRFYDAVRQLEPVKLFSGQGPEIGIYRIR